ncbi:MAG: DNA-processing protein DprA [Arenicellales bacterium]|nr:DNA-processing protein DprA [Arenicellales bacterium]
MQSAERDNVWLSGRDRSIVGLNEASYPFLLSQIPDPPLRLYVEGQVSDWLQPAVAVVGSRNPTAAGEEFAFHLAHGLAEHGIVVVSGLALGIDSAAHKGAMAAGGMTIAVCGTGLDIVYPRQNRTLADQIRTTGGLVSEFCIGTGVRAHHFPRRNRLISGLTLGTVVVEAGRRSGSLITARHAAEQGREVFAVPGPVFSPLSRGPNALIRDGARLVESVSDITEELSLILPRGRNKAMTTELSLQPMGLLAAIGVVPTPVNQLIDRTGLTVAEVSSMLITMELEGVVTRVGGGFIRRVVTSQIQDDV